MTEDAERLEDIGEEEENSEPVVEAEEPAKKKIEEKKEKKPRANPLGFIFNLRMLRRFIQIGFFIAINAYIFVAWFGMFNVTNFFLAIRDILPTIPILSPLEAPFAVIAGSFDTLQQTFSTGLFPFFTLGAMILILIFVGRAPCGWICPIGTIQDFVTLPKKKKIRPAPNTEIELRKFKAYIFVIVAGLAVWVGFARATGTAGPLEITLGDFANDAFAPLNPANILFSILADQDLLWPTSFNTLWYFTTWGFVLLQVAFVVIVFAISFWIPRWFCRWLCPAGWLYSIFSREAMIGIGRNPARCTPDTCNVCEVVCPMNIRIRKFPYQHMHSPDCIMCLECKSHCPNNAIVLRFS